MPATWKKLAYEDNVIKHSLATAANDFLVASGAGAYVKKTLAETRTILSLPALNYAVGDLLYASSTSALSKLADVAVGSVLVSGGVGVAPAWSATPSLTTSLTVPLIKAPAAALAIRPTTDAVTAIQLQDQDGNSILNVDTTNNRVGVMVAAPDVPLDILSNSSAIGFKIRGRASDNAGMLYLSSSNGAAVYGRILGTPTDLQIGTTGITPVLLQANGLTWMRITPVGNVSIGGSADRGTTVGAKALQIFDGTAPAGTLTNGCSIYSTSGELFTMDAGGTATQQTPHDKDGLWIFNSIDTKTGKQLKIDMEKMMRFLNDHFGTDFVHDSFVIN